MRSRSHQADHTLSSGNIIALLSAMSNDIHSEALISAGLSVIARDTQSALTYQPIDHLPMIATESDLHLTKKKLLYRFKHSVF
jgi:hypothetical protein